jgi:HK97 family phage portal protein
MTFLDRLASSRTVIPFTPSTYDEAFADRHSGLARTMTTSMSETVPIVYICTHVVSEDIAKVALHVTQDLGLDAEGRSLGKRKALDHEWYDALHHETNQYQTAIDFREMMTAFALNRGRGVARKETRRVGRETRRELEPLHPDLVTRDVDDKGRERWKYQNPILHREEILLPDEVLVLWGPRRRSVIDFLRELLAIMKAGQDMQGQMRKRGPRHTGVIMRPKDAPKWGDKGMENFRKAVDEYMGEGENAGRPMLLQDGMTWINSSLSLADSEFIASAQLDNALVCGAYRVPQHKAGLLERSTNNNIQQQATDYVVDCLLAWAIRWEQSIRMSLLSDPFQAKHNLRTLLRGDPKTAAETAAIYGSLGWLTGNEARDDEDRNPLEELWDPRLPLNMGDVPGTSVAEMVDSPVLKAIMAGRPAAAASPPVDLAAARHRRQLVHDGAARVVRKEVSALSKLAEQNQGADWEREVRAFYRDHAEFTAKVLRIDEEVAEGYCVARSAAVLASADAIEATDAVASLTQLALNEPRTPEGAVA